MITKLSKARAALVLSQPFFGSLALRLRCVADATVETMAVDGESIFYNPDFVESLTFDEITGVVAHEVMHLACAHHARRGERDPRLWNRAGDYAINGLLIAAGFTLPAGRLQDSRFDDMPAEEIYAVLERERTNGSGIDTGAPGEDPGGCGAVRDAPGEHGCKPSPAELSQAAKDWQIAALQAAQVAGELPAGIARLVDTLRQPRIDWRHVLRRFVETTARSDYQWFPPNRRYISMGFYLPSIRSDELGPIVIAIDTSGSIRKEAVEQFAAELSAVLEDCRPEIVHLLYCDRTITGVESLTADDLPLKLNPKGGGGTDFRPPFDWVGRSGLRPACLIYLTDLKSRKFPAAPDYPVLWVATSNKSAPFGETLPIGPAPR